MLISLVVYGLQYDDIGMMVVIMMMMMSFLDHVNVVTMGVEGFLISLVVG